LAPLLSFHSALGAANMATGVLTSDGIPLKVKLQRAERRTKLKALGLVVPLFIFIIFSFVAPIGNLLLSSVYDPSIKTLLPKTVASLDQWDGEGIPDEYAFAALVQDLKIAQKDEKVALLGKRLNYEISAIRSKIQSATRKIETLEQGPYKQTVLDMEPALGTRHFWTLLKRSGSSFTPHYLLNTIDMRINQDGNVEQMPQDRSIYIGIYGRTLLISLTVTLATLLLGYPVAWLIANLPTRSASLLLIFVLLPFWTSLLVRTTAWFVLLQDNGIINDALIAMGLTEEPLKLIFSRFGTIIAMTHIQLPFTLLPIYSVMKTISPTYMRAARSLGAGPVYAFTRIYMPQTLPGVAAGCLLTFILSLGYYITPALVGGPTDQMISGVIADSMNRDLNWGKASALGAVLLMATVILYFVYDRLVGIDKMKLG
jgi:putative spermidine/putrescine transport system permease protein